MAIRSFLWGARTILSALVFAIVGNASNAETVTLAWNANPEPDIGGYKLFWGEVNTSATLRDVGNVTQTEVADLIPGRSYYFYITAYNTAGLESDPSATITHTMPSGPPPIGVQTEATFVRSDAATSGSWKGAYALEGGFTANVWGVVPFPSYVKLRAYQNYPLTWTMSTTDSRALQDGSSTNRFATAWHSTNSIYFYLNFTDTAVHQVALYFVDFDRQGREQLLEFYDNDTGQLLGMETISDFEDGRYLVCNLRGNIRIKLTRLAGPDCVLSAIFLDPQPTAFASYLGADATTSGSWRGVYGTEGGLAIPYGYFTPPSYVRINAYQNYALVWSDPTRDPRALQKASGIDRFAGAWNSTNYFDFYLRFQDTAAHEVAFYFVDYDGGGRREKLEVFDLGTGNLLHSTVISEFEGGVYHRYKLSGSVRIRISNLAGVGCVMSGIFFDSPENSAAFVAADTATSGTWKGVYGSAGNSIATEAPNLPANVSVNFTGTSTVSWSTNTTDTAALQRPLTDGRLASAWSAQQQLNGIIDSGPDTRQLSLYFVDFDNQNRKQIVELIDTATGAALDHTELDQFRSGVWLTYTVRGGVSVRITSLTGATAVISGVFFD